MILYPAIGANRYCGPAALAILSGQSTTATAALLRQLTGKRAIMGVPSGTMMRAMHALGFRCTPVGTPRRTLRALAEDLELPTGVYLVIVTGHYVVLDTRTMQVSDNHTVYPVDLRIYSRRRKFVKSVWRITPCPYSV